VLHVWKHWADVILAWAASRPAAIPDHVGDSRPRAVQASEARQRIAEPCTA